MFLLLLSFFLLPSGATPFEESSWFAKERWIPIETDVSFSAGTTPPPVSDQCWNDTVLWKKSIERFFAALSVCEVERSENKNCSAIAEKALKDNFFAIMQLDAFGKLPAGMLDVTLVNTGSYPECMQVEKLQSHYKTQYCYLETKLGKKGSCDKPMNFPFRAAVCMPSSCSEQDLTTLFTYYGTFGLTACSAECVPVEVETDWFFWFYTILLGLIVATVLIASIVDYILDDIYKRDVKNVKNTGLKCLLTFSLYTNAPAILNTTPAKEGHLKSLDCIRFLSIMWVVSGHTMANFTSNDDLWYVTYIGDPVMADTFLSAFYAVDTFFLLSGIVVSYLFFKTRPKLSMIKSPIAWIFYYVHRFIRLTTPYMLFIGFFIAFGPFINSSQTISTGNNLTGQISQCRKFWWINILYIINYFKPGHACYGISWYLAADMQLYFVAPIFLVLLYFSHLIGVVALFAAGTGSVIATFVLTYHYDLPASPIVKDPKLGSEFMNKLYIQPWIRGTPYLIGLWVGYFLAVYGKKKIRFHPLILVGSWMFFTATALACVYGPHDYLDFHVEWSKFVRSFFYSFSRIGWALSVSWVIIANFKGWGGPIAKFMDHPLWQPLGRISYCIYITHWMIIYYYYSLSDKPLHMNSIWQTYLYYSMPITVISTVFAILWSCCCEVPFIKLEKMGTEALFKMFRPPAVLKETPKTEEVAWQVQDENVEKL